MKKQKFNKILKAILAPVAKGLFIFAVFAGALYVYAAISYPPEPNAVTGIVGQFTGLTTSSYDGSRGGYSAATALCNAQFAGSHICTSMEMINTYNHNPTLLSAGTGQAWINNGAPAHSDTLSNDCKGWNFNQASQAGFGRFGSVWYFTGNQALIQYCNVAIPFACCK
jgi:hypothetical protein